MKLHGIKRWAACGVTLFAIFSSAAALAESQKGEKGLTVTEGKEVSIEYTLRLKDGEVVDTNAGSEPLTFTQGAHQIIPGLESAMEGMKVGESKKVTVKPEDGYGVINESAFQEVKKEQVPKDALKVGARLQARDAAGRTVNLRVAEIKDQTVVLDFNHPLAGKSLFFDVKVLNIKDAKK
ncbi:MAG: peptidylprolyl isomerase [Thermodesulfobacteriota bacterium]